VFTHIPFQLADPLSTLYVAFIPFALRELTPFCRPSPGDHDDEPNPSTQGYVNNTYTGLDLKSACARPFFLIHLRAGSD
jgi:hypothetical protein